MTGLQLFANVVLAVLAFLVLQWLFAYTAMPEVLEFLIALVVAVAVFFTNSAARLGVK